MLLLPFIVFAALVIFYFIMSSDVPGTWKFGLAVLEMFIVGSVLIRKYKLSGEHGLIMLKTKKGLKIIDSIAKSEKIWMFFADIGTFLGYGFSSYFLMRKNFNIKSAIAGCVILFVLTLFVAPVVLPFISANIRGALPVNETKQSVMGAGNDGLLAYASLGILIFGGLFLVILSSLLLYASSILSALYSTLVLGTKAISQTAPGATFLLPGINIPFVEGVIALAIILLVHEGSHAILGRIARVPILSSGIVLFGIIPIGAFVEPDEEFLKKVEKTKQTRVLVAGSAANLFTSVIFFVIFIGFMLGASSFRETGILVVSGMEKNTVIYSVNGQPAADISNMKITPNMELTLETNKGTIKKTTDANGKIGITYYSLSDSLIFARFKLEALNFIYMILGLVFTLNFVIGTINLLPLPFFDGYRLLELNIKDKRIVKGLMYLTLVAFLMNFVPWFF